MQKRNFLTTKQKIVINLTKSFINCRFKRKIFLTRLTAKKSSIFCRRASALLLEKKLLRSTEKLQKNLDGSAQNFLKIWKRMKFT